MISNRGKAGNNIIERKVYNLRGEEIDFYAIKSDNHSIIESKVFAENTKEFYLSLFGNKNSKEATGIQIDFVENKILKHKKEIYFLEIKSISNFFKDIKDRKSVV